MTGPESPMNGFRGPAVFCTTHWTVVLDAAQSGAERSHEGFARVYLDYWYPLYVYIRRRGYSPPEAEDIAQDFFIHLIEQQSLEGLRRQGGRFRTFLLRLLENFLVNQWDRARAQKRGGGSPHLVLNSAGDEARFALEAPAADDPEHAFEQRWVFTLLARVLDTLQAESATAGKAALFAELQPHLQGDRQGPAYAEVAARQGMSEGAVKVAAHRLRQRYGELLREEVARTVSSPAEVDEELRHLIAVIAR